MQIEKRLARGDTLTPLPSVRLNFSRDGDVALLHGDGETLRTSLAVARACTIFDSAIDAAQWAAWSETEHAQVIDLVRRGWIGFS